MSACGKGNLTRFSHDSGEKMFHLKIGSSGKKSLVKCSRTASIMSNFTTWHCVKDVMDKKDSIDQLFTSWQCYRQESSQTGKCSSAQVFRYKFVDKKAQVFKFKFVDKKGSSAQVFKDRLSLFFTTLWYFHGPTRWQPINKTLNPLIKSLIRDHPHHLPSHHICLTTCWWE